MHGPRSVRALLDRRDRVRVSRWGFCLTTFTNTPRTTALGTEWFDTLFADPDGVASYFRRMSGARRLVEWQVFTPGPLMTLDAKQALDASGADATIAGLRNAAKGAGIPVDSFDRFMWFLDDNGLSSSGTTPSDSLVGAVDFTPQLASHEMTHAFGVNYHADKDTLDDYADPFCVMGKGPIARSFENPWLTVPAPSPFTHSTTGPGICAPYLYVAGWLDYQRNVVELPRDPIALAARIGTTVTLAANQGAPTPGSPEAVALTFGGIPQGANDPSQYWVEYRRPRRFDRGVDRPVSTDTPDMPPEGVVVIHEVRFDLGRGVGLHAMVRGWTGASTGNFLALPWTSQQLLITGVDADHWQVSLTIRAPGP
jgi:hypothetical protein